MALEGPGPQVLGLSVRERNRRVLLRAGVAAGDRPEAQGETPPPDAIVVPATLAITPACVPHVLAAEPGSRLTAAALPNGTAYDVSTPAARREASRALLLATGKPTDGWVARRLNRPISRVLSRLLLAAGLSPAHATLLSLATGAAAAAFAAQPSWGALVAAAAFFQLASVVDGVDGEMARATLSESAGGARLDAAVDIATYVACCAAFIAGWVRGGVAPWERWLAALVAVALGAALWQAGRFVRRHAPDASFVFVDRAVDRAARDRGGWGFRAVRLAFLLMRRDAFAVAFLALAVTGRRAAFILALGAFALVALATFRLARGSLAAAASALRRERDGRGPQRPGTAPAEL